MSEKIKNRLIVTLILKQICVKFQSYELAMNFRDIERTIDSKLDDIDRDNLCKEFNYSLHKLGSDWIYFFENTSDISIPSQVKIETEKLKLPKDIEHYLNKIIRDRKIASIL